MSAFFRAGRRACVAAAVASAIVFVTTANAQASQERTGSLVITVLDQTGASIPHATVTLFPVPAATPDASEHTHPVSSTGLAVFEPQRAGDYRVVVSARGFQPVQIQLRVSPGRTTRRRITLAIADLAETVDVRRDPQTAALDRRGFSTFLSRGQIDALPDDPDAFARALQELAPPGAVIRIDGFTGGMLPPKSQILSIRIPRFDTFAAEDHGGLSGISFIDIVTRPGGGQLQGSVDAGFNDAGMSARNAFARDRPDGSTMIGTLALDGPVLANRASFALAVRGSAVRDTTTINAAIADGSIVAASVTRPQDSVTASGRLTAAIARDQILRVSVSGERRDARHLGVGDYNLPDRGYRLQSVDTVGRAAIGGPVGRSAHLESRIQARWAGTRSVSDTETPAVRVLDAFSSGGAQTTGGSRSLEIMAASDIDYARGVHAWRGGLLLETGRYHVNRRSNYLGTFTFASLDDYRAGRPATFSRRIGDARVAYANAELGLYVQDDFRISRSMLLSYGIRYERQFIEGISGDLLPRLAVSWSPWRSGGTVVRAAWGEFTDWIPTTVYEQSLLVDGQRQYDIHALAPPYPDPGDTAITSPRERYLLSPDLRLASIQGASVAVEHQVTSALRLHASYARRSGNHLLRGENLNPPIAGERSDAAFGNIVQARADARARGNTVTIQGVKAAGRGRVDATAAYIYTQYRTNTSGPFSMPPGDSLDAEWGPSGPAHAATSMVRARLAGALVVALSPRWRSGVPYTITSGRDENRDGLFTDRPPGVARNSARTPPQWDAGARISYTWQFGRPREIAVTSAGGDIQSLRGGSVAGSSRLGPAASKRFRLELYANGQNVTNRVNYAAMSGVQQSPLFGRPTTALAARKLDVGVRLAF